MREGPALLPMVPRVHCTPPCHPAERHKALPPHVPLCTVVLRWGCERSARRGSVSPQIGCSHAVCSCNSQLSYHALNSLLYIAKKNGALARLLCSCTDACAPPNHMKSAITSCSTVGLTAGLAEDLTVASSLC